MEPRPFRTKASTVGLPRLTVASEETLPPGDRRPPAAATSFESVFKGHPARRGAGFREIPPGGVFVV